jgi:hypothetical protein
MSGNQGSDIKHYFNTSLLRLVDAWIKDIDNGKMIGAVFLDLRKGN